MGNPLHALWCLLTRHRRSDQQFLARQRAYRREAVMQTRASLRALRELRPLETAIFADEDDRRSGEDRR